MKKIIFLIIFLLTLSFSNGENVNIDNKISFNLEFDKYFREDLNNYVYIKTATNIRKEANTKSKIIKRVSSNNKLPILEEIKDINNKVTWYKVKLDDNRIGFVSAKIVLKRGFNWQKATRRAIELNNFINLAISNNKAIYYIDCYQSLSTTTDGKIDEYGNAANQSIKAYYDNNKYINLQDRSIFTIESEDEKSIYIKTFSYGERLYRLNKNVRRMIKNSNITTEINKFIYVDRKSQTQITLERNEESGIFNVNAVGFVTTGITGGKGFVTPYGDYLVAYTKPIMKYVSDFEVEEILDKIGNVIETKPKIVGEAKMAIRFSGGGYLHGIPATYGDGIEERKKHTESKLGTFELSHKCVRHADDLIKYVYNWVNEDGIKDKKSGFIYPKEAVIVMVE